MDDQNNGMPTNPVPPTDPGQDVPAPDSAPATPPVEPPATAGDGSSSDDGDEPAGTPAPTFPAPDSTPPSEGSDPQAPADPTVQQ